MEKRKSTKKRHYTRRKKRGIGAIRNVKGLT